MLSLPNLLTLSVALTERLNPDKVFMISAAHGDGVPDLKDALAEAMPEGPWLYPEDEVSDATDRMIAAELTREQLVNQLHQELPYATAVETETWEDRPDGSSVIRQQILVERDSQKAIVIGKGGQRLKSLGAAAREEIAAHLGERERAVALVAQAVNRCALEWLIWSLQTVDSDPYLLPLRSDPRFLALARPIVER